LLKDTDRFCSNCGFGVSQNVDNLSDPLIKEKLKELYLGQLSDESRDPNPRILLYAVLGILILVLGVFGISKYHDRFFSTAQPTNTSDVNFTTGQIGTDNSPVPPTANSSDMDFIDRLNAVGPDTWTLDPASPNVELSPYNFMNAYMSSNGCEVFVFNTPDDAQNGFDSHLIPFMYVWKGQDNVNGLGILVGRASIYSVSCLRQVWKVAH